MRTSEEAKNTHTPEQITFQLSRQQMKCLNYLLIDGLHLIQHMCTNEQKINTLWWFCKRMKPIAQMDSLVKRASQMDLLIFIFISILNIKFSKFHFCANIVEHKVSLEQIIIQYIFGVRGFREKKTKNQYARQQQQWQVWFDDLEYVHVIQRRNS